MSENYTPRPGGLPRMLEALADVCREEGYDFAIVDAFSQQLVRVEHRGFQFFAGIGRIQNYPLNSATAASLARDKAFTYQTLAAAGIAVPPYGYFFLDTTHAKLRAPGRERADAFAYAASLGYPVFVKPLDGARGALADQAFGERDLARLLDGIALRHHAALIQPVFSGEEWRLFLLDGVAQFAYRRAKPELTGDGCRSIAQLLDADAQAREGFGLDPITIASPFVQDELRRRGLSADSVLGAGETFAYSPRGNISAGGALLDYTETPPDTWINWARRILNALTLRVGAVDFFAKGKTLTLLEVNHSPDLAGIIAAGHDDKARAIWRQVLRLYFVEAEDHR